MVKTENIIFRCSEDLKNTIQAKLQDTNMSISEHVTSLIQINLSHNKSTPLLTADRIVGMLHFSTRSISALSCMQADGNIPCTLSRQTADS